MKLELLLVALTVGVSGLAPPEITEMPMQKRVVEVKVNKDFAKLQQQKNQANPTSSSTTTQKPWVRTLSDNRKEIVTPTVIAGVTFGGKPPATTDGLEPWISLDKVGQPKTIQPQMKDGKIKKAWPTYGTWFATPTTIVHSNKDSEFHNIDDPEFHEETWIDEDPYEHSLNPMIRCTPERYSKKGMAKDKNTEPFCTPQDNVRWIMDKTYFITWYSGFFDKDVENVRIVFSYVKQAAHQKGWKRSLPNFMKRSLPNFMKRSSEIEKGGKVQNSFYITEWIKNTKGYFPLLVDEEWIGEKEYQRKVLISIQPDNVEDEEFDLLEKSVVVEFSKGVKVNKEHLQDLKKLDEKNANRYLGVEVDDVGIDYEKYMIMMGLPTCAALFGLFAYLFVWFNMKKIDLSSIKKKSYAREKTTHRRIPFRSKKNKDYTSLPQYNNDIEMKND